MLILPASKETGTHNLVFEQKLGKYRSLYTLTNPVFKYEMEAKGVKDLRRFT